MCRRTFRELPLPKLNIEEMLATPLSFQGEADLFPPAITEHPPQQQVWSARAVTWKAAGDHRAITPLSITRRKSVIFVLLPHLLSCIYSLQKVQKKKKRYLDSDKSFPFKEFLINNFHREDKNEKITVTSVRKVSNRCFTEDRPKHGLGRSWHFVLSKVKTRPGFLTRFLTVTK